MRAKRLNLQAKLSKILARSRGKLQEIRLKSQGLKGTVTVFHTVTVLAQFYPNFSGPDFLDIYLLNIMHCGSTMLDVTQPDTAHTISIVLHSSKL